MTDTSATFETIAVILAEDFGIPFERIEPGDFLADDWGLDLNEQSKFVRKFCDTFGVSHVPENCRTIAHYVNLVNP